MKPRWATIIPVIFFIGVFLIAIIPSRDPDIWFHLKSGEVISKLGIIHYDVFSHSASGREWIPYEWFFQIITYYYNQIFGFQAIKYLFALVVTIQIGLLYSILRKIFKLNLYLTMFLGFFFIVSVYEFLTARPQVFAYTFIMTTLYLIFLYLFKNVNRLWITLPITLAWVNMHGSIFLDVGFFGGYAVVSLINYFLEKDRLWLKKAQTLGIYTVITGILTVLPPLGTTQYRLLWRFFEERNVIAKFIDEWTPLTNNPPVLIFLSTVLALAVIIFLITAIKQKSFRKSLWALPILPFTVVAYTASRNVYLAYITIVLMLGWSLSQINFKSFSKTGKIIFLIIAALVIAFYSGVLYLKRQRPRLYYPVNATEFIKQANLKGNMFNEYGAGGYLLYHLYPEHKVFYDGRTDVYLCCEMPDTLNLAYKKQLPDNEYKVVLDELWKKYKISYVLLRSEKHSVVRKIARILTDDSNWSLVFWDDDSQLFVKKDGKNDDIIRLYGVKYATPYNQDPFRKDSQDQALNEYLEMIKVVDSAKSRNAVGYIYLRQGKIDQAQAEFEKATILDPSNESPLMNLAEIAASKGDNQKAIDFYKRAQKLASDRGLIYIRLGQLYQTIGEENQAKNIWRQGLKKTVDESSKKTIKELLYQ